jgi:cysteine desulfurase
MMKLPIFMDNHSTTPVDPRVLEAMLPYFSEIFGNAASRNHMFGWKAEEAVEKGRGQIAALIHADPKEIVFTSGATEADNLAVKGVAEMYAEKGDHIITCVTEHKAILDTAKKLEKQGRHATFLPVDKYGQIDLNQLRDSITDRTILISIMYANNEIGTLQKIREIGRIAKEKGVLFHCDAVQAIGKIPVDVEDLQVDLMSISAHKMYGPKGVGALYVRKKNPRVRLVAQMDGGGHERGMRSGTLNVSGIVGFGKACEIAGEMMQEEGTRLAGLRDRLHQAITSSLGEVFLNGHPTERLPNNLNLSFAYVEGESLLMGLENIAVSSGSACTSATLEPSYVLKALGVGSDLAHTSIRFGLGRFNTMEEVDYVGDKVITTVKRLREMSPLYEMAKEGMDLKKLSSNAQQ